MSYTIGQSLYPKAYSSLTLGPHVVGQIGFGKVVQVRKLNGGVEGGEGRIFALKPMSKYIVGCGEVNGVRTEARVLRKFVTRSL